MERLLRKLPTPDREQCGMTVREEVVDGRFFASGRLCVSGFGLMASDRMSDIDWRCGIVHF